MVVNGVLRQAMAKEREKERRNPLVVSKETVGKEAQRPSLE